MQNKLIPLTDFVLNIDTSFGDYDNIYLVISKYAEFLKQPLELGMLISCVDGEPLTEPDEYYQYELGIHSSEYEEYETAKKKVLFEGVKYQLFPNDNNYGFYTINGAQIVNYGTGIREYWHYHTIEQLANEFSDIILTPTALKMIYGKRISSALTDMGES